MPAKGRKLLCFGVDVDAVAGWLGSYGGEDSPGDISRGMFAGEVGAPRLLKLFAKYGIKTTWFIPGHSLDTFPEQMAAVRDAGHEILESPVSPQYAAPSFSIFTPVFTHRYDHLPSPFLDEYHHHHRPPIPPPQCHVQPVPNL
ncbi:hypothetical protein JCM24511_08281 [Saitozyma sp. JCM 24511]|nr:hypothetical protein JCM24511_08281 [Saitozyma sp. JCM 24511]